MRKKAIFRGSLVGLLGIFLFSVVFVTLSAGDAWASTNDVCFCHITPGNPHTICTSYSSEGTHRDNHGDQPFSCECGDGICTAGDPAFENCSTCPQDCGACPACGNGTLEDPPEECEGTDNSTCAGITNCGGDGSNCACDGCRCSPLCVEDGVCNGSEDCNTCAADCGQCSVCGNEQVEEGEDCDPRPDVAGDCCTAECKFESEDTSCTDNNACTEPDKCDAAGSCKGGAQKICTDEDECTTDSCDSVKGCQYAGVECTDGDSCTSDTCDPALGCDHPKKVCDDKNPCTQNSCDTGSGCDYATLTDCNDNIECTADTCDSSQGCMHEPLNSSCNDRNFCTDDSCDPSCTADPTDPDCDKANLGCRHTPNTASCDDGSECTTQDACSGGQCVGGSAPNCNDKDGCTDDSCNVETGCVNASNSEPCDDGNVCTVGDMCVKGGCQVGQEPLGCDDGNPCTDDSCDPKVEGGCVHTPNTAACDDYNPCTTNDACSNGECLGGAPLSCDDSNPCTDDSCQWEQSPKGPRIIEGPTFDPCVHTPDATNECSDGNACNGLEQCSLPLGGDYIYGAECKAGEPPVCDDANICTGDSCDPAQGCKNDPIDQGTATCGVGACLKTVPICDGGNPQECVKGEPKTEVCENGIDENCDGIDDSCGELAACIALDGNHPAVVTFSDPKQVSEGVIEIPFSVVDPDGDTVNIKIEADEGSAVVGDGVITYTVPTPLSIDSDGSSIVTVRSFDSGSCQESKFTTTLTNSAGGDQFGGCSLIR